VGATAFYLPPYSPDLNPIEQVFSKLTGILILIVPRLLSFIVAIYLIIVRLIGLNAIHHFIR
jgi:transposase